MTRTWMTCGCWRVYLPVLLVATLACPETGFSQNLVSRPAGFVRLVVPAHEQRLLSMPFRPFDPSIGAVLADQLTGGTNAAEADCVLKWDTTFAEYVQAVKVGGRGNGDVDGRWVSERDARTSSDLTLLPGDGFVVRNRQALDQTVALCGEVAGDSTNTIIFAPSLTLFGYPYSTSARFEQTKLWELWAQAALGSGVGDAVTRWATG
jgi:hypothetical protein